MPRIALTTVGCKVNQYETEVLAELFRARGYEVVSPDAEAEICLLNSCTVTSTGDQKTRQLLRRMKKRNPGAIAVLTGCFPQAFPEAAAAIPEADIVTGELARAKIPDLVERFFQTGERIVEIPEHKRGEEFESMQVTGLGNRTRAYVKIEDGCERYCSYCIIPKARGPIRSKPMGDIERELLSLAEAGYKEVVLVGINLSSYGKEIGLRLIDAVRLACSVPGIKRVRLGSLEPELLSDEDIHEMASFPTFCPQFHLALQSGCDRTLRSMNRHYDTAEYERIVRTIEKAFDGEMPVLTTDIMVGFPGETDEDFQASADFAEKIGFARVHVFSYSRREGTPAAARPTQVPEPVKSLRSKEMIRVTDKTRTDFLDRMIGRIEKVLIESTKTPFGYEGYTANYTPVLVECGEEFVGRIVPVELVSRLDGRCVGRMLSPDEV